QSGAQSARVLTSFQPATSRTPLTTIQPATALRPTTAQTSASTLVSSCLLLARQLSTDLKNQEQIEDLVNQIESALRAAKSFNAGKKQDTAPDGVIEELQAALANARTALSMAGSDAGGYESAKLRLGWTAARLKRANDRLKQK
ncbi:MAG: hypothetical protein M3R69_10115, partial [Acidobacteriota bacterium]|nr:hypothetical protein [Acidobacteriota bacterium]